MQEVFRNFIFFVIQSKSTLLICISLFLIDCRSIFFIEVSHNFAALLGLQSFMHTDLLRSMAKHGWGVEEPHHNRSWRVAGPGIRELVESKLIALWTCRTNELIKLRLVKQMYSSNYELHEWGSGVRVPRPCSPAGLRLG